MSESAYEAESTLVNRLDNALDRCAVLVGGESGEDTGEGVAVALRLGIAPRDGK